MGCSTFPLEGILVQVYSRYMEKLDSAAIVALVRRKSGLTQSQLASRAGTSQPAVARYESGEASPSTTTLLRLLRAGGYELEVRLKKTTASDLSSPRARKLRRARGEINALMKSAGASNVRIFGSVARGQDKESSDIDFLVDFDTSEGLLPIVRLNNELSKLLGERVDVAPVSVLRPNVLESAIAEAVPL